MLPSSVKTLSRIIASLLMLLLIYWMGYTVGQSDFQPMIYYYLGFFAIYLWTLQKIRSPQWITYFIGVGIVLRFVLVFSFPNLSDDVYRFIWDGRLVLQGINPFYFLPADLLAVEPPVEGINQELFNRLNSPAYYTIYPPLSQAVFTIANWCFPNDYYGAAVLMKAFLFLSDCGSLFLIGRLLQHFKLPPHRVLIYALNPLIILEITGNLHFEGMMIFFLLWSLTLLLKKRLVPSAITFALSIATKLLPLMFLPYLIKRLGWKRAFGYFVIIGLTLLICFAPLLNPTFLQNFKNSFDLYFQKFEFNASIYYLLRWIGIQINGYNLIQIIGPILATIVLVMISSSAYLEKNVSFKKLPMAFLFAICTYLFLATTIHPWYVALPLVLCLFTPFRFPILWSALIFLTYINYSYAVYFENLWIVGIEYGLVFGYLIYEIRKFNATPDTAQVTA